MPKREGRCYCGSLRYAIAGDPLNAAICHCKSCQRQTGSAFSVVITVPRGSLSMEGSVATYEILAIMARLVDDISARNAVRR